MWMNDEKISNKEVKRSWNLMVILIKAYVLMYLLHNGLTS